MISNLERRTPERGRMPFELPVELAHDTFDETFAADAVDLSPGGLSLRSDCLPDVGDQLLCRFETVPGGTQVSSMGEVVWTHRDGKRPGEFGLRFVRIEPEARALIDEMVAERTAHAERFEASESAGAPRVSAAKDATLELDGVDAPLSAKLTYAGGGAAVFEQRLDLLELGRGVVAKAGAALGRGNIGDVSLRMDGDTPTLAVTVTFEGGKSLFGEFDWETVQSAAKDTDTVPDLNAPAARPEPALALGEDAPRIVRGASVTVTEFGAANDEHAHRDTYAQADEPAVVRSVQPYPTEDAEHDQDDASGDEPEEAEDDVSSEPLPASLRETAKAVSYEEPSSDWAHPVPDSARSSVLVRFLRIIAAVVSVLQRGVAIAQRAGSPAVSKLYSATRARAGAITPVKLLPNVRLMGRSIISKLSARPRRTTAAPAAARQTASEGRSVLRIGLLSGLGVCALALGAYALLPSVDDGPISLHRKVQSDAAATAAPAAAAAEATPSTASQAGAPSAATAATPAAGPTTDTAAQPAAPALNAAYARSMAGQQPMAAAPSTVLPTAAASTVAQGANIVPATSPYAVDVRAAARDAQATSTKTNAAAPSSSKPAQTPSFGAKVVPNAERFVLRMNAPVKTLQGKALPDGFVLIIPGSLAVDRAGPIKARHKAVALAAVLNKGDHSELTIRFVGKSPAYRVTGRGSELELLIAQ